MVEVQKENLLTQFPVILSKKMSQKSLAESSEESSKEKTSENSQNETYGGLRIRQ